MPFTRYQLSCVGGCNRPQSPARRTGHHTANVLFPPPPTLCPHKHLRNDLVLIRVSRASILPTVCDFSRLSLSAKMRLDSEASRTTATRFSANIRLHTEASFTNTRELLKQHREHFRSSKSTDINNRVAFPDSITPEEHVRAQVRPPFTSL